MAKRAREVTGIQLAVEALLKERAAVHVIWNGRALDDLSPDKKDVRQYIAGGIALIALRAGSPYPPLVGTMEVVLTVEDTCVRVICGVGERNAFSDATLARVRRQQPSRVGRTEFLTLNGQLNIGFCVSLTGRYIIPDELVGDDQIVGVDDVLFERELPNMRDGPLRTFPPNSSF